MSTPHRTSDGKYASLSKETHQDGKIVEIVNPKTPPNPRLKPDSIPFLQESYQKDQPAPKTAPSAAKSPLRPTRREAVKLDCATVYRAVILFNSILVMCLAVILIAKWLVFVYFLGNVFVQGTLYKISVAIFRSIFGRAEVPPQTFYSRLKTALFPADMIENSPNFQITVRDSARIGAVVLIDENFPLSVNNVVVHLAILAALFLTTFILTCLRSLLVKVARLAKAASPEPDLERRYGSLPTL